MVTDDHRVSKHTGSATGDSHLEHVSQQHGGQMNQASQATAKTEIRYALGGSLKVEGLTKHFQSLRALQDVNLEVEKGRILGLIGPNGSGKTTFINVVTGHLKPTAGRVELDGREITAMPAHRLARAHLARTYQNVRIFGTLSVFDNVVVAALSVGIRRREAERNTREFLDRLGIARYADTQSAALSYGHKRLVEIARALSMKPSYLLLDEPAAGMNDDETLDLLERIRPLPADYGLGILIVDHDIHLIMELCDLLHVLNFGQTIAEGSADEVRKIPAVIDAYLGRSAGDGDA